MYFDVINSGSKGNATLVFTNDNIILIDMGICISTLEDELAKFNKGICDINALLVTHNHTDHIKNIKCLSPKKMYSLDGTIPGELYNKVSLNKSFIIGKTKITPFKTSHDATNPCGYMIEDKDAKLVYMTDTGVYLDENTTLISNPDYLIIESNHDIKMLMNSNRTKELKKRILSEHGHLCNEDSAFACLEIIGDNTKEIILAHLSEECNTPELALKAYNEVFAYKGVDISKYKIRCANQHVATVGGNYEN